jgi:3-mercaptopyruvate sulfurtransferase SseA
MNRPSKPTSSPRGQAKLNIGPIILMGAGVLILLSLAVWKLSPLPAATTPPVESAFETPYPEIARISLVDAKAAYDQKKALFVDVRDSGSFDAGHVTGAVNIPLADIETRLAELPKDRWIILYCT